MTHSNPVTIDETRRTNVIDAYDVCLNARVPFDSFILIFKHQLNVTRMNETNFGLLFIIIIIFETTHTYMLYVILFHNEICVQKMSVKDLVAPVRLILKEPS